MSKKRMILFVSELNATIARLERADARLARRIASDTLRRAKIEARISKTLIRAVAAARNGGGR